MDIFYELDQNNINIFNPELLITEEKIENIEEYQKMSMDYTGSLGKIKEQKEDDYESNNSDNNLDKIKEELNENETNDKIDNKIEDNNINKIEDKSINKINIKSNRKSSYR